MLKKIQNGLNFFTANYDYKKSDLYRDRFAWLRQQALEKVNVKVLKILREVNAENNLKVVASNVFEKASQVTDLDV